MASFADYLARNAPTALARLPSDAARTGGLGWPQPRNEAGWAPTVRRNLPQTPQAITAAFNKLVGKGKGAGPVPPRDVSPLSPALQAILDMLPKSKDLGTVLTEEQIRAKAKADVEATLGPLFSRENESYGQSVQAGEQAVKDYTGFFANRLSGIAPQVAGIYDRQRGITAGLGDALAGAQTAANAPGISSFATALAQMGAPGQAEAVGTQQALSSGAVGMQKAYTASELMRQSNEGAAQEGYAAMLPGLGVLQGGQTLANYLSEVGGEHAGRLGDIEAQNPTLTQALIQGYTSTNEARRTGIFDADTERAKLAADLYGQQSSDELKALIANQGTTVDLAKIKQAQQEEDNRFRVALAGAKNDADANLIRMDHYQRQDDIAAGNLAVAGRRADAASVAAGAQMWRATHPTASGGKTPADKAKTAKEYALRDAISNAKGMYSIERDSVGDVIPGEERVPYPQALQAAAEFLRARLPDLPEAEIQRLAGIALRQAQYPRPGGKKKGTAAAPKGGGLGWAQVPGGTAPSRAARN